MDTYRVWIDGEEADAENIKAYSASDAAEKFIKKYESESVEYSVAEGKATANVVVADNDDRERKFVVSGYAEPVYDATETEDFE